MTHKLNAHLPDESATNAFAALLAESMAAAGAVIYLQGDLGAGKTTLVRGLLQAMGYTGRVVSPTYTLIEPYDLPSGQRAYHLDLYRVADPEELVMLGLRDINPNLDLMLVEWPELVQEGLPDADLLLVLQDVQSGQGRQLELQARSARSTAWLECLAKKTGQL